MAAFNLAMLELNKPTVAPPQPSGNKSEPEAEAPVPRSFPARESKTSCVDFCAQLY